MISAGVQYKQRDGPNLSNYEKIKSSFCGLNSDTLRA